MSYRDALNEAIQHWSSDSIEDEWFLKSLEMMPSAK